ncbi:glycosyltransferase family 2 protein [Paracoccus aerodenitrificans]|uniref:glycosyltransferase family 2 protein n=1 Tax=Paracoccus aerodenitrificans TaxID=3017781 RepID=UPI0022F048E5|nr:glycosyltransferase family 2 protein [Paracoccus aerodenitrificans]WBU63965.1 glycosyltransferase family 2 protein [Paracoccus aerodenitrificans]
MNALRLRAIRQWYLGRAIRRHKQVVPVKLRVRTIGHNALLCFVTLRNEYVRLPYFLDYYRRMGIGHFLIVDNNSDDGSAEFLQSQPDVSLWRTTTSYKSSRFGMDWINWLLFRYGTGHWCLTVDPDEFLVFPNCDTRPLQALTHWMSASGIRSFPAMLLDLYPRGRIGDQPYVAGQNPMEIAHYFDPANYMIHKNGRYGNLWIQGGPRARSFFASSPKEAPALNKIPLIRWERHYVYISSTHMALPRALNLVYDENGGERISGVLLHAKFLSTLIEKSSEEMQRGEHYANSVEYRAYNQELHSDMVLLTPESRSFEDWRQLEELGLMSLGNWV